MIASFQAGKALPSSSGSPGWVLTEERKDECLTKAPARGTSGAGQCDWTILGWSHTGLIPHWSDPTLCFSLPRDPAPTKESTQSSPWCQSRAGRAGGAWRSPGDGQSVRGAAELPALPTFPAPWLGSGGTQGGWVPKLIAKASELVAPQLVPAPGTAPRPAKGTQERITRPALGTGQFTLNLTCTTQHPTTPEQPCPALLHTPSPGAATCWASTKNRRKQPQNPQGCWKSSFPHQASTPQSWASATKQTKKSQEYRSSKA